MLDESLDDGSWEDTKTVAVDVVGDETDGSVKGFHSADVGDVDGHFLFWTLILSSLQSESNCNIK